MALVHGFTTHSVNRVNNGSAGIWCCHFKPRMSEPGKIVVRPLFRVLAGIIAVAAIAPVLVDPIGTAAHYSKDLFDLLGVVLLLPLFIYCALKGKLPDFMTESFDEETFHDVNHAEKFFTEFSPKSIGFAVVAALMMAYAIYKQHFM